MDQQGQEIKKEWETKKSHKNTETERQTTTETEIQSTTTMRDKNTQEHWDRNKTKGENFEDTLTKKVSPMYFNLRESIQICFAF